MRDVTPTKDLVSIVPSKLGVPEDEETSNQDKRLVTVL